MGEDVIVLSLQLFWGGMLLGVMVGGLLGWLAGFRWGVGTGCLLIGLSGLAGAINLGWHRWQAVENTVQTTGILTEVVSEITRNADGEASTVLSPVVRFVTPDGAEHRVKGLGGSQATALPGDAVPVRYQRDDPSQALVADFQNVWGGVWGLGVFGAVPLLFGIFFLAGGADDTPATPSRPGRPPTGKAARAAEDAARRKARAPQMASPRRKAVALWGARVGTALGLLSFAAAAFYPDEVGKAIAVCFFMITAACVSYAVSSVATRAGWQTIFIVGTIGFAFLLFGLGLWWMS